MSSRLAKLASKPHLPRRTVRLRLTLLYGGLFLASGAALLAITYLLVRHSTGDLVRVTGTRLEAPGGVDGPRMSQVPTSSRTRQPNFELGRTTSAPSSFTSS